MVQSLHVLYLTQTIPILSCVVPENIYTSPMEGIFSNTSPPLWKFQLSFIHFFKFFGLIEPPTPQEIPIPSVGEYGYFLELHIRIW